LEEERKFIIVKKPKNSTKKLNLKWIETWVRMFVHCDNWHVMHPICNQFLPKLKNLFHYFH
jgi:hypothetical protein